MLYVDDGRKRTRKRFFIRVLQSLPRGLNASKNAQTFLTAQL